MVEHDLTTLPFMESLNLSDLSKVINDPIWHVPSWTNVAFNLSSYIPNFEGKQ